MTPDHLAIIDIDALEKLAKAATPGEWRSLETCSRDAIVGIPSGTGYIGIARLYKGAQDGQAQADANAAFIAAANPQAILALISEKRALEQALERVALLDEADGHLLTVSHAFEAVAIATKALGKHPSEIYAARALTPSHGEKI